MGGVPDQRRLVHCLHQRERCRVDWLPAAFTALAATRATPASLTWGDQLCQRHARASLPSRLQLVDGQHAARQLPRARGLHALRPLHPRWRALLHRCLPGSLPIAAPTRASSDPGRRLEVGVGLGVALGMALARLA